MTEPKPNPYLTVCRACYTTVCTKCWQYEDRLSPDNLCGCAECQRYMKRVLAQYRRHLREYDHGQVGKSPDGVITWQWDFGTVGSAA